MKAAIPSSHLHASPGHGLARGFLAFAASVLALSGCRDAPTDPLVGLVAQEAYAALALGVSFPDPVAWNAGGELDADGAWALEEWRGSWDLSTEDGRVARETTYASLAAGFARAVTPETLAAELALLSEGVVRAEALMVGGLPPHVALGIEAAGTYRTTAAAAHGRGESDAAVEALLRGADALREVGPEAVARALQGEVEGRLGSLSEDHPYSEQVMERLQRLVRGGRQALDEGDWVLAIRRAFYAKGLFEGNG